MWERRSVSLAGQGTQGSGSVESMTNDETHPGRQWHERPVRLAHRHSAVNATGLEQGRVLCAVQSVGALPSLAESKLVGSRLGGQRQAIARSLQLVVWCSHCQASAVGHRQKAHQGSSRREAGHDPIALKFSWDGLPATFLPWAGVGRVV